VRIERAIESDREIGQTERGEREEKKRARSAEATLLSPLSVSVSLSTDLLTERWIRGSFSTGVPLHRMLPIVTDTPFQKKGKGKEEKERGAN
jgi:hypothetical protein